MTIRVTTITRAGVSYEGKFVGDGDAIRAVEQAVSSALHPFVNDPGRDIQVTREPDANEYAAATQEAMKK